MNYECKYPPHLQAYLDSGGFDEKWSRTLRNFFLDRVISSHVKGLKVIETGSKSGVFTYAAHYHGAKECLGIEYMPDRVQNSSKALKNIPSCNVIQGDSRIFDPSGFDVALCLGLLYNVNDEDKKKILEQMSKCKLVLVEFWTRNNDNPNPTTEQIEAENGLPQWLPNNIMAEKMLSSYFNEVEDITPKKHIASDHQNRYYVCKKNYLFL